MLSSKAKRELKIDQRQVLIDSIEVGIPSADQILVWGERRLPNGKRVGQVKNSKTVNYKRFTPFRDGLFCERIFGPVTSLVCACGKKQPHAKVTFCEKCSVEYTDQRSRRYRLGYISLVSSVTHIWYLKGRPSYISLFLGKRKKTIMALAYCNAYLVEHTTSRTDTDSPKQSFESAPLTLDQENHSARSTFLFRAAIKKERNSQLQFVPQIEQKQRFVKPICLTLPEKITALNAPYTPPFASSYNDAKGGETFLNKAFNGRQVLKSQAKNIDGFAKIRQLACVDVFGKQSKTLCHANWSVSKRNFESNPHKRSFVQDNFYKQNCLSPAYKRSLSRGCTSNTFYSSVDDSFANKKRFVKQIFNPKLHKDLTTALVSARRKENGVSQVKLKRKSLSKIIVSPPSISAQNNLSLISRRYQDKTEKSCNLFLTRNKTFLKNSSIKAFIAPKNKTKRPPELNFVIANKTRVYTACSYTRGQTLPFLPSLVCNFYLRDTILNFFITTSFLEDRPLVAYCSNKRCLPLQNVHRFMAEQTVANLTDTTQEGYVSNASYKSEICKNNRPMRQKDSCTKDTLKRNCNSLRVQAYTQKKNKSKRLKTAICPVTARIGFKDNFLTKPSIQVEISRSKQFKEHIVPVHGDDCVKHSLKQGFVHQKSDKVEKEQNQKHPNRRLAAYQRKTAYKLNKIEGYDDSIKQIEESVSNSSTAQHSAQLELRTIQEILSYTGGGALERLLSCFKSQAFEKFLFSETEILSSIYQKRKANKSNKKHSKGASNFKLESNNNSFVNNRVLQAYAAMQQKTGLDRSLLGTEKNHLFLQNPYFVSKNLSMPLHRAKACTCYWRSTKLTRQAVVKQGFDNPALLARIASFSVEKTPRPSFAAKTVTAYPNFVYKQSLKSVKDSHSTQKNVSVNSEQVRELAQSETKLQHKDLQKKQLSRLCRRIFKSARRLKIAQLFSRNNRRPEWMVLSHLPVLPPDLRPILQMSENVIVASDLNNLYQRVIYRNNRHYRLRFIDFHLVSAIQRLVQDAVDRLIENGKAGSKPYYTPGGRVLKSLSDTLKGKKGRFRLNLLGKRVDFSGRSVIVVSPSCKIHECGLPKDIALELYHYFLLRQLMLKKRCSSIVIAKKMIKERSALMWDMLRELIYHHPVLLNRAPTLHRLGIQAFQPKLVLGNAILLHPLVCSGFNADFDGDQMGVHLPLCFAARAETWDLLWSRNNLLSPATGQPMLVPSQDMVLGFYYITQMHTNLYAHQKKLYKQNGTYKASTLLPTTSIQGKALHLPFFKHYNNTLEIIHAFQKGDIFLHTPIWLKWGGKLENIASAQKPLELRVNSYGSSTQIYSGYKYFSSSLRQRPVKSIHKAQERKKQTTAYIESFTNKIAQNSIEQTQADFFVHPSRQLNNTNQIEDLYNAAGKALHEPLLNLFKKSAYSTNKKQRSCFFRTTVGRVLVNNLCI